MQADASSATNNHRTMTTSVTRRDLLKLAGGSAVGLIISPLPWKLLDDTAIWTQNWKGIPKLSGGPIGMLASTCPLCPTGCAIQVRTAAGIPSSITGAPADPVACGTVCPAGLAGHHLAFHPLRPARPLVADGRPAESRVSSTSYDEAYRRIGDAIRRHQAHALPGSVVVMVTSPDKAATSAWESLLTPLPDAQVVLQPSDDDRTLTILRGLAAVDPGPLAFAPAQARTILSFGAPVLDGWHGFGLLSHRKQRGMEPRVIQVETFPSRTALAADRWLQIRPGTEGLLALAIAGQLDSSVHGITREEAASATGLSAEAIRTTAAELAAGPSIVIAGCEPAGGPLPRETERLIAGLNLLAGNPSRTGGIVPASPLPGSAGARSKRLDEIPAASVGLLIVDGCDSGYHLPMEAIRRILVPKTGTVAVLTPSLTPLAASADIIIPIAPAYQALTDAVSTSMTGAPVYAVIPPLHKPGDAPDSVEVIRQVALKAGLTLTPADSTRALVDRRIDAIASSRRGSVVNPVTGSTVDLASLTGAADLKDRLMRGERWIDTIPDLKAGARTGFRFDAQAVADESTCGRSDGSSITLMPFGVRSALATGMVSPMLSKVFQETGLRELDGTALMNPETARKAGIAHGAKARLTTSHGSTIVTVRFMSTVRPDVIHVAVGPRPNGSEQEAGDCIEGITRITAAGGAVWRIAQATIEGGSING
jgi:menaquinone reductase, molybdopterin-binding-like subunit